MNKQELFTLETTKEEMELIFILRSLNKFDSIELKLDNDGNLTYIHTTKRKTRLLTGK